MTTRLIAAIAVLSIALIGLAGAADAEAAGDAQRKAAAQAGTLPPAGPPSLPTKTLDAAALSERVVALERENLVLREDLGKARLDLRTGLDAMSKRHAEEMARLQQKIDALNADLAAERKRRAEKDRTLWIAVGLLAIGVVAAN